VYRARDTRLGRDVAIKILPQVFTALPDRLARFEREARVLASLNHPNIGAIYGLEEADGLRGLVLELVEGETLAERIRRPEGLRLPASGSGRPSGLPVAEALGIATQLADALDAAHERGIVHRDLKPANIKITPDGIVKVLDFGLAKAATDDGVSPDLTHSPTITVAGTREGVLLGTVAYMSPEQARGQAVDKRTDIWAFGCVLYELLTGRAAFGGETVSIRSRGFSSVSRTGVRCPGRRRRAFACCSTAVSTRIRSGDCATSQMRVSNWTTRRRVIPPRSRWQRAVRVGERCLGWERPPGSPVSWQSPGLSRRTLLIVRCR
jgi:serine/threonine protein kinase